VIYHALARAGQDRQIDRRSAYVAATRARDKFTILTDSKKRLGEAVSKDRSKASIADFEQQFKSQFRLKKIQNKIKAVEKEARSHRPKVDMGDMGMGR
jgi:ATP-dependent exoDNAse (exonuclease V) alpha subunit